VTTETHDQVTRSRAACYRYLSACYCLPEGEFLSPDDLAGFGDFLADIGSEAADKPQAMAEVLEATAQDEMRIEYSRLFVGPFKLPAPPYGSVYLDDGRRLMGDSTIDAIRRYREAGVDVDPVQEDVPDHIAIELEFMAYLVHLQEEAATAEDSDALRDALDKQIGFLDRHLCAWVPEFAAIVKAESESAFYTDLADATETFLAEDLARVREEREQL
jgi:putative dimethyl sulfoxide reductase chaperone